MAKLCCSRCAQYCAHQIKNVGPAPSACSVDDDLDDNANDLDYIMAESADDDAADLDDDEDVAHFLERGELVTDLDYMVLCILKGWMLPNVLK